MGLTLVVEHYPTGVLSPVLKHMERMYEPLIHVLMILCKYAYESAVCHACMTFLSYFPPLKEYLITSFGQTSTQVPHRMHSEFRMELFCTIPLTSRLMGQFCVHLLQLIHLSLLAFRRNAGHLKRFLILVPITINGAIQQI